MTQQTVQQRTPQPLKPTGTATILFGVVSLVGAIALSGFGLFRHFGVALLLLIAVVPVVVIGAVGAVATARTQRGAVAVSAAVQGVGIMPAVLLMFGRGFGIGRHMLRRLVDPFGGWDLLCVMAALVIVAGAIGVIALGVRARRASRAAIAASRPPAPPQPAGYTADGRPFYPIVGYTPEGTPITADQAPGYHPPSSGTNSMAITAFILAFTFAILAIPFGHMARSQIRKTGEGGGGLALAALIIGYLNVAVLIAVGIAVAVILYGNV